MTEQAIEKPYCFIVTPEAKPGDRIRVVVDGEAGYRATDLDNDAADTIGLLEAKVATYNARLGVSDRDVTRMTVRSMFGRGSVQEDAR
jgi:hypothetical protein